MILLPTIQDASAARRELLDGADFARLATERSGDISATRGGLLEPISRHDASYPDALRDTLFALEPGEISGVVLIANQHAILCLEREIPATEVDRAEVTDELTRAARIRRERVAMDALANSLLANVPVVIFDDSLNDAWERKRTPNP